MVKCTLFDSFKLEDHILWDYFVTLNNLFLPTPSKYFSHFVPIPYTTFSLKVLYLVTN